MVLGFRRFLTSPAIVTGTETVNGPKSRKKPGWVSKIGLAVCSILLCYALILIIARCYSWQAGIHDRDFRYENGINMWRPDPVLGFVNKRNFSDYCFGTVHVTTNDDGFRGQEAIPPEGTPGRTRIIGLGDSVMWGTCVDDSESFLGLLNTKLKSQSRAAEVINAGVVGYSTLQECLLLEKLLPAFSPDVVVINFCENDLLPTEDPFHLVRDVHLTYINQYVNESGAVLTSVEQNAIGELVRVFELRAPVHMTMGRTSAECRMMAVKLFLEIPIRRMAQQAKANNAELIYLLIPPRDEDMIYLHLAEIVKHVLDENQVAYLDLRPSLKGDPRGRDNGIFPDQDGSWWLPWLEERLLPDARAIKTVYQINAIHREQNYIDFIHPSRKGNEIIAQRILEHLSTPKAASGTEP